MRTLMARDCGIADTPVMPVRRMDGQDHTAIAARVAATREALDLSQAEFARRLDTSPQAIGNYESGIRIPKWDMALRMWRVFGADPNWIYAGQMTGLSERLIIRLHEVRNRWAREDTAN